MRRLAAVGLTLREKSQIGSRVTVLLPNGDLTAEQMRGLADLARRYSGGNVRATSDQNLVLRWIRSTLVGPLSRDIEAIGLVTEATE
jgi:sulfite reductase beta subunit-like hemoprotein